MQGFGGRMVMSVRCHARGQGSIPGGAEKSVLVFDLIKALSSTMRSLDCELDVKIKLPLIISIRTSEFYD